MPGRIRSIAALVLVAGFAGPALSQEAGRITRVVLYPGSAAIERSARVAAGSNRGRRPPMKKRPMHRSSNTSSTGCPRP